MHVLARLLARTRYRAYLRLAHKASTPSGRPSEVPHVGVLQTADEWQSARAELTRLRVVPHQDRPKNWDTRFALATVLANTSPRDRVLDAGAALYSALLPSLALYGYESLHGVNLIFRKRQRFGPVDYIPGDLTKTPYPDGHFAAVTCLSVIEHGVPLEAYFREMSRILAVGGILVTSTDYWQDPIDTGGQSAYGVPITIFTRAQVLEMLALAERFGLFPKAPIAASDLACRDRVVRWERFGLDYTFAAFTLEKRG